MISSRFIVWPPVDCAPKRGTCSPNRGTKGHCAPKRGTCSPNRGTKGHYTPKQGTCSTILGTLIFSHSCCFLESVVTNKRDEPIRDVQS